MCALLLVFTVSMIAAEIEGFSFNDMVSFASVVAALLVAAIASVILGRRVRKSA